MSGNPIKNFFKRKKAELKFMGAGPGRKLNAAPSAEPPKRRDTDDVYVPPQRSELTPQARTAAEAAMNRVQNRSSTSQFNTSMAAIRMQVKRELDAEKQAKQASEAAAKAPEPQATAKKALFAVEGVFYRCPMIGDEVLSRSEWRERIRSFLFGQLEAERGLTACLIIHNTNPKAKAEKCVETLSKYIENIVTNPDNEKYRKIRMSNRIFEENVRPAEGSGDFLRAAGFIETTIDGESFLLHSGDNLDELPELLDALRTAEKISLELDRNLQVLVPSQARNCELPADFYRVGPEEVKREQRLRAEAMESSQQLKTKAMRDKEEMRTLSMYNYSLVRVRFPDGVLLQGTFGVQERFGDLLDFVRAALKDESMAFSLLLPPALNLSADEANRSLFDMRLLPNVLLIFEHDRNVEVGNYLKDELLMLIQN